MKDVAPDDLGMDPGPFMRTESYRALFKPRHTQLCGYVHRNSRMRTFLHTCGSIYDLIPDLIEAGYDVINPVQTNCLIEAGYDVINPVQTNCRNMDPARLKREFGRDIAFWARDATRATCSTAPPPPR